MQNDWDSDIIGQSTDQEPFRAQLRPASQPILQDNEKKLVILEMWLMRNTFHIKLQFQYFLPIPFFGILYMAEPWWAVLQLFQECDITVNRIVNGYKCRFDTTYIKRYKSYWRQRLGILGNSQKFLVAYIIRIIRIALTQNGMTHQPGTRLGASLARPSEASQ